MAGQQEKYVITREYLGEYSVRELLEKIIRKHLENREGMEAKNNVEMPVEIL